MLYSAPWQFHCCYNYLRSFYLAHSIWQDLKTQNNATAKNKNAIKPGQRPTEILELKPPRSIKEQAAALYDCIFIEKEAHVFVKSNKNSTSQEPTLQGHMYVWGLLWGSVIPEALLHLPVYHMSFPVSLTPLLLTLIFLIMACLKRGVCLSHDPYLWKMCYCTRFFFHLHTNEKKKN